MSFSNPIRFGTNSGLATADQLSSNLWLPVYGGEVLAAFDTALNFAGKVKMRSIETGTTAKFPVSWKIGSEYHEVGSELLGLDSPMREANISLDDRPLVSHFELDDIDVAMAHFEYRAEMAAQTGKELAKQLDKRIACLVAKAATDNTTGGAGGAPFPTRLGTDGIVTNGDLDAYTDVGATALLNELETLAIQMDERDVPADQRYVMVVPGLWYALRNLGVPYSGATSGNVVTGGGALPQNAYFGQPTGALGYDQSLTHLGFQIYRSVNAPWGTNVTNVPAKYQVNFTKVRGLVWHPDCCGVVQKIGISTEMDRDVRRQSDFMVAKMLTGGGTLRPYCACILRDEAP
jgi:hypothetical protein